jgi:hypothetical protein
VKFSNLVVFSTGMDFLGRNGGICPPAENEMDIMQHLQNLSEPFLSYHPFSTENSDSGNI